MNGPVRAFKQGGWSLVELAVALVIAALITAALVPLLPLGARVATGDTQARELARAEEALLGYALAHSRLPPADANADFDGTADEGATEGWLPVKTLGLPPRLRIRYAVQGGLAELPGDIFQPYLSPDYSGSVSAVPNGLDLCARLLLHQRGSTILPAVGTPAAYALVHTTQIEPAAFTLPGSGTATEDTATVAAGIGELASRLACPDRLARAQGAAQGAMAAYSAKLVTDFNHRFRVFDIRVAELVEDQAETGLAFAAVGLALAIADEAIAITLTAAGWPPEGFAIAVGIAEHVVAVASIIYASVQVALAEADLQSAKEGLATARENERLVNIQRARLDELYKNASQQALVLDTAGLHP